MTTESRSHDSDLDRIQRNMSHYARLLWDVQKVRIAMSNRIGAMEREGLSEMDTAPMRTYVDDLARTEHAIDAQLKRLAKRHFMADWIEAQPGIGLPGFARIFGCTGPFTPVLYHGQDCECDPEDEEHPCPQNGSVAAGFPNVAKLWAYLGLHVTEGHAPKRKKGEKANWSSQGRVVCHQIGDSIVKVGKGPWREAYDTKKAYYEAERPDWSQARRHNAAMRYSVKELLKAMWVEWMQRVGPAPS